MIIFATALMLAGVGADLRHDFSDCLKQASAQARNQKVGVEGFVAFARTNCASAEAPFQASLVSTDVSHGMSKRILPGVKGFTTISGRRRAIGTKTPRRGYGNRQPGNGFSRCTVGPLSIQRRPAGPPACSSHPTWSSIPAPTSDPVPKRRIPRPSACAWPVPRTNGGCPARTGIGRRNSVRGPERR